MNNFIAREPAASKFFSKWYGARKFMLNAPRYCLCLRVISQNELKNMPLVYQRVKAVRNFSTGNYIAIPKTSSEKRFYIPIGFLDDSVVCADSLRLVSNAELYHFGALCGRKAIL